MLPIQPYRITIDPSTVISHGNATQSQPLIHAKSNKTNSTQVSRIPSLTKSKSFSAKALQKSKSPFGTSQQNGSSFANDNRLGRTNSMHSVVKCPSKTTPMNVIGTSLPLDNTNKNTNVNITRKANTSTGKLSHSAGSSNSLSRGDNSSNQHCNPSSSNVINSQNTSNHPSTTSRPSSISDRTSTAPFNKNPIKSPNLSFTPLPTRSPQLAKQTPSSDTSNFTAVVVKRKPIDRDTTSSFLVNHRMSLRSVASLHEACCHGNNEPLLAGDTDGQNNTRTEGDSRMYKSTPALASATGAVGYNGNIRKMGADNPASSPVQHRTFRTPQLSASNMNPGLGYGPNRAITSAAASHCVSSPDVRQLGDSSLPPPSPCVPVVYLSTPDVRHDHGRRNYNDATPRPDNSSHLDTLSAASSEESWHRRRFRRLRLRYNHGASGGASGSGGTGDGGSRGRSTSGSSSMFRSDTSDSQVNCSFYLFSCMYIILLYIYIWYCMIKLSTVDNLL